MSEKHDLAALCSLLDRPVAEFIESEPFKKLEQETDVIRYIEPFGLPEIKRLICCSNFLAEQEWTEKYSEARKLYDEKVAFDVPALLMQYKDAAEFEKKILSCVDGSILGKINEFFKKETTEKEQEKKERSSLKGKITKARKKCAEEASQEATAEDANTVERARTEVVSAESTTPEMTAPEAKSKDEIRVEKLDKLIAEKEKSLKFFAKHASKTASYLNQVTNLEAIDAQRQKAYTAIDKINLPAEEEFLMRYIDTKELSAEEEKSLRNDGFLQRFIELFDKDSYRDMAFSVLAKLYSDNAIDLECDLFAKFIGAHSRMLAEYLGHTYSSTPDFLEDTENRVFLEYSIKGTLEGNNDYITWWNAITKASDWKIILDTAEKINDDSLLKVSAKLMHHVSGTSMDAFMELLLSDKAGTLGITPAEFIIELIGQEAPDQRDIVRGYIRSVDKNVRKLQRRVAIKEREINRHSQELFSALYQPLEQLEQLAVNLRHSDGEIKCRLVASHVINALADLRESLSALGLDTADEVAAWRNQSFVDYDPKKHRMPSTIGSIGEQVKLQTLGFAYTDDEGNNKIKAAEVYIPAPVEVQPEKISSTEELAVNLRHSDGEIKCRLVASHVINALADLRKCLSALGLDTAAEAYIPAPVEVQPEKISSIKVSQQNQQKHPADNTPSKKKKVYPKNGSISKKPKKNLHNVRKGKKK